MITLIIKKDIYSLVNLTSKSQEDSQRPSEFDRRGVL